jgi:hypothetical protein
MQQESPLAIWSFVGPVLIIILLGMFSGYLVDSDRAIRVMNEYGYTNATVAESARFEVNREICSRNDSASFLMNAIDRNDQPVASTVCCNLFLGCTVQTPPH